MDVGSFVEGPILWVVFLILLVGTIARLAFFVYGILVSSKDKGLRWAYIPATLGRFFAPFHSGVTKKPLYAILRYVFHICLIIVPIWLYGHIVLWAQSRFEWEWTPLPDVWADWITLLVLALVAYFLIRRLAVRDVRLTSTTADYILIVITALPFMTGYFLTHGTLDSIAIFGDNIRLIHVLSGEAMIVMAAFLFCRTRLNEEKCTGCAACELSCPTSTLESRDEGALRIFTYSHYQCICCGACVSTCPEDAADLRHEISFGRFLQIVPKHEIRSVELKACERCGALFAPVPQLERVGQTITDDYLRLCPKCKKVATAEIFHQLSPWQKPLKKAVKSNMFARQ